ncbi:septal ring lytic transglycosylase RlpA family protein [Sphingomonas sp.]|uniref:septal ring lytic transglycosylase RlpA family protein n=1 Tax=Sphingomonas sp. TaxID=28214 RepID=UPI003AFFD3FA
MRWRSSVVAATLVVAACSGGERPRVDGRYAATGIASWYGAAFAGRRTASGERFDPRAMTAAHRTLPFGTLVEVTALATGRALVVRINDRGPGRGDRLIDLSQAAARRLGIDREPSRVSVRTLQRGRDAAPAGGYDRPTRHLRQHPDPQ